MIMGAVFKRELKAYLHNVYGLLFAAVLLLCFGALVFNFNLSLGVADLAYALYYTELVLVLMVPVLCMRSMAEDRHNKTDMFYLSLPMKTRDVVLGKYLALLAVFALPMLIICVYPLLLTVYGTVNLPGTYAAILAFFLLGAALIAVCQFLSSLTGNQIIAAIASIAAVLVLFFMPTAGSLLPADGIVSLVGFAVLAALAALAAGLLTKNLVVGTVVAVVLIVPQMVLYAVMPELFADTFPALLAYLSPFAQYEMIVGYGIFNLTSVTLLLSYAVFFVFLTVQSADRKRWC